MSGMITRPLKENEDGIPGFIAFPEREEKGPALLLIHQARPGSWTGTRRCW